MLNSKQFREIYNEYLESGLTVRDYCANQNMNEAKFYYWQNKLKSQLPPKNGFVPVFFRDGHPHKPSGLPVQGKGNTEPFSNPADKNKIISCEISYPNGVSLKLNSIADMEILRSLLHLPHHQQDV
jgi:hypothetical protein